MTRSGSRWADVEPQPARSGFASFAPVRSTSAIRTRWPAAGLVDVLPAIDETGFIADGFMTASEPARKPPATFESAVFGMCM